MRFVEPPNVRELGMAASVAENAPVPRTNVTFTEVGLPFTVTADALGEAQYPATGPTVYP
jgi:hypothetical protein